MSLLPRRVLLVEQVTAFLRGQLRDGRWTGALPGEHALSSQLQVSRSTLRLALATLRREGLIRGAQGQRARATGRRRTERRRPSRLIAVVSSQPLARQSSRAILSLAELRRQFYQAGFELELHVVPQTVRRMGRSRLQALGQRTHAACWVLVSCSSEVQRWFAASALPALVHGSCHAGVDLPAFRIDAAAVARHAFGLLHRQGHRRIGLLLPPSPYAGALEVKAAMQQARDALGPDVGDLLVRDHAGGAEGIRRALATLRAARPPITALIVMMPSDALTAYCQLLEAGCRLPRDISLISIFDDFPLSESAPAVARYTCDPTLLDRKLARAVIRLSTSGSQPPSYSLFPRLVAGTTLGPARS